MHYQESETVELKQEFSESIRKEIVAFANSSGGKIYISILDDGEVIGVHSADQMIQRIANTGKSEHQRILKTFYAFPKTFTTHILSRKKDLMTAACIFGLMEPGDVKSKSGSGTIWNMTLHPGTHSIQIRIGLTARCFYRTDLST